MDYIQDIGKLMSESYTRVPENNAALQDLINMREKIMVLMNEGTPNVPAGMPNGISGLNAAYKEVNIGIRELINKDTEGYKWG